MRLKLGAFEEVVLLAIFGLGDEAYGVPIRDRVQDALGSRVSFGSVYAALEQLESKGYVTARLGESTPERGGRAKRYYKLEGLGQVALDEVEKARLSARIGRVVLHGGSTP